MKFISDVTKNDNVDLLMNDGQESDLTMAPFYSFLYKFGEKYCNSMNFSGSDANPTYNTDIKGIKWRLKSGITFCRIYNSTNENIE